MYVNSSESISLSNGLYVTTTNVGERSKITLNIREIKDTLSSGQKDLSKKIYEEASSSITYFSFRSLINRTAYIFSFDFRGLMHTSSMPRESWLAKSGHCLSLAHLLQML